VAVQSGCSASVCRSRSQGPRNQRPQPSIGQPHLSQGLAGVVEAEQGVWPHPADLQTGDTDMDREQALDLAEGAGEGAAEGTVRPHSAPAMLELAFEKR
jgi:hypothetical protein